MSTTENTTAGSTGTPVTAMGAALAAAQSKPRVSRKASGGKKAGAAEKTDAGGDTGSKTTTETTQGEAGKAKRERKPRKAAGSRKGKTATPTTGLVILPEGIRPTMSLAASVHAWRFGTGLDRVDVRFEAPGSKGELPEGVPTLVIGFPGMPGNIDPLARAAGRYVGPIGEVVKTFEGRAPNLAKRLVELVTLFGDDPRSGLGAKGNVLTAALEGRLEGVKLTSAEIGFVATWHSLIKASNTDHRVDSWRESFRAWFLPLLNEERAQVRAKELFKASALKGKGKVVVAPGGSSDRLRRALFAPAPFAARAIVETRRGSKTDIAAFVVAMGSKEGLVSGALLTLFGKHDESEKWRRIPKAEEGVIVYLLRKGQETALTLDGAMEAILANF